MMKRQKGEAGHGELIIGCVFGEVRVLGRPFSHEHVKRQAELPCPIRTDSV